MNVPAEEAVYGTLDSRRPVWNGTYEVWRLIAHVAAVLSGTGTIGKEAHAPEGRIGSALLDAGVSPARILRLTSLRGPGLHDQIRLVARRIAKAGTAINLWLIYHLASDNPDAAERARIRIAQEYQAAVAAKAKENQS